MNWGVIEWSALAGVIFTIISAGMASYLGVVKSNISTKKDIDNGFEKLREIEEVTKAELIDIKLRLNSKSEKIQTLETMLFEYLKKHEAEEIFCKKIEMQPKIDGLISNQNEIKDGIKDMIVGLNRHIDDDIKFKEKLFLKLGNKE